MNIFKRFGLRVQFNAFVLSLLTLLFIGLSIFVYQYAKSSISKRNSLRVQAQIEDFVDMFDVHNTLKIDEVKHDMLVASNVLYNEFEGDMIIDRNRQVEFDAVNQITKEQFKVQLDLWIKGDLQLQHNTSVVDKIMEVGPKTSTIFQRFEKGYLRIATNVRKNDGTRATGTYLPFDSPVVQAIERGEDFHGRAFVVNDWYLTYYTPIKVNGEIVGMFYVGEQEKELQLIKEKFYNKEILKAGHPFIISNAEGFKGQVIVDKYIEGENLLTSENTKKLDYYQALLNAYNNEEQNFTIQSEGGSSVFSFETQSPMSENRLVVFFEYFPAYDYFIGVVIPKDDFITTPLNRLFLMILMVITVFTIISIILVNRFVKRIVDQLKRSVDSIELISKGELPDSLELVGNDELTAIALSLNNLRDNYSRSALFARQVGEEKFDEDFEVISEQDLLGNALVKMRDNLIDLTKKQADISWIQTSTNSLNDYLRQDQSISELCNGLLAHLSEMLDFKVGTIYINYDGILKLTGSYAYSHRKSNLNEIKIGEGLVGQAAMEKKAIVFDNPPEDYMVMQSGLGESNAKRIVVVPLVYKDKVIAVIEMARAHTNADEHKVAFLEKAKEPIAVAIQSMLVSEQMQDLLDESIKQKNEAERAAQELAASEEELRQTNEMMAEQTNALKRSESDLQEQQEELRVTNEELQEKTRSMEIQSEEVRNKNNELEKAQVELEKKAQQLEQSSKYKSEFLANMSHELRTPLNSLLILSRDLADNSENNLSADEVESAQVIYNSGNDLLHLINDILDLSKIEAGKMPINLESFDLNDIKSKVKISFERMMTEKKLELGFKFDSNLPAEITTDPQRLDQIIKNLMSNAIKFTKTGSINLEIERPKKSDLPAEFQDSAENVIAISVVDTGIGIPVKKQQAIFDAFQQADGSTSRKFGGTGLGLSITKELIHLLGGQVNIESTEGVGSKFTIYHPINNTQEKFVEVHEKVSQPISNKANDGEIGIGKPVVKVNGINGTNNEKLNLDQLYMSLSNDNMHWFANKRTILIIDNNEHTINKLIKQSHDKGFNSLAAFSSAEGFEIARKFQPHAIMLNVRLNGGDSWDLLDKLKEEKETAHIPVHLIGAENEKQKADNQGAIGLLSEPLNDSKLEKALVDIELFISNAFNKILIVEDDKNLRLSIRKLIRRPKTDILEVADANSALETLKNNKIDCMILDLGLPDMSGIDLLDLIRDDESVETPPTIVYTGKDLSIEENDKLRQYTNSIIIKGERSEERLLDETALFLHKIKSEEAGESKVTSQQDSHVSQKREGIYTDKTMLIVDDDMRNVFALSKVLKNKGMNIVKASNGQMALDQLKKHPEIDFVLMDIMMPGMDGYEAMKEIRKLEKYAKLPIVALTAKAMKGDKEKCIAAGANDYLSKPLDVDQLLSLMRVWLYN